MPIPQEKEEEEIDLNETARKQGLMTDDEFQSILDGVNRMEVDTEETAEGLDLASQVVGEGKHSGVANESEGAAHQPVEEVSERQSADEGQKSETPQPEAKGHEKETEKEIKVQPKKAELQPEGPEITVPTISKSKAGKRKLVLKNDPEAERQKPKRVSQRCLAKWASSKAKANIAATAVEVSSGDKRATPTKPGEEPSTATNLEDAPEAEEMVAPTPND